VSVNSTTARFPEFSQMRELLGAPREDHLPVPPPRLPTPQVGGSPPASVSRRGRIPSNSGRLRKRTDIPQRPGLRGSRRGRQRRSPRTPRKAAFPVRGTVPPDPGDRKCGTRTPSPRPVHRPDGHRARETVTRIALLPRVDPSPSAARELRGPPPTEQQSPGDRERNLDPEPALLARRSTAENPARPSPGIARGSGPRETPDAPGRTPSVSTRVTPDDSRRSPIRRPSHLAPGRAPGDRVVSRPITAKIASFGTASAASRTDPSRAALYAIRPATYSAPRIRPSIFSAAIPGERGRQVGEGTGRGSRNRLGSPPWPYRRRTAGRTPRFPLFPRVRGEKHCPSRSSTSTRGRRPHATAERAAIRAISSLQVTFENNRTPPSGTPPPHRGGAAACVLMCTGSAGRTHGGSAPAEIRRDDRVGTAVPPVSSRSLGRSASVRRCSSHVQPDARPGVRRMRHRSAR